MMAWPFLRDVTNTTANAFRLVVVLGEDKTRCVGPNLGVLHPPSLVHLQPGNNGNKCTGKRQLHTQGQTATKYMCTIRPVSALMPSPTQSYSTPSSPRTSTTPSSPLAMATRHRRGWSTVARPLSASSITATSGARCRVARTRRQGSRSSNLS